MNATKPEPPANPCSICGSTAWYLPGDDYWGKKAYLCGMCHPEPRGKEETMTKKISRAEMKRVVRNVPPERATEKALRKKTYRPSEEDNVKEKESH